MTQKRRREIKERLSRKRGSAVYNIFYEGLYYRMKADEVLITNDQLLEQVGLPPDELTEDDRDLIRHTIDRMWHHMRKDAANRGLYFATLQHVQPSGEIVYLHGYTRDPAKLEAMKAFTHYRAVSVYQRELREEQLIQQMLPPAQSTQSSLGFTHPYAYQGEINQAKAT